METEKIGKSEAARKEEERVEGQGAAIYGCFMAIVFVVSFFVLLFAKCQAQDTTYLITIEAGKNFKVLKNQTEAQADSIVIAQTGSHLTSLMAGNMFFELRNNKKTIYCERKFKKTRKSR